MTVFLAQWPSQDRQQHEVFHQNNYINNENFISISDTIKTMYKLPRIYKMIMKYPVKMLFTIALFHYAVSIVLLLYALYANSTYGYVSTQFIVVLLIWIIGAFIITLLGVLSKYLGQQISRIV